VDKGPYFNNADSRCSNRSYTVITRGAQGGLVTGSFQPNPSPAFTKKGSALANGIMRPVSFTGIALSVATNQVDPQMRRHVPTPSISLRGGQLSGQVQALSAAWDKIFINQGSPKPGGGRPGSTTPVSGTYNARTHAFVLTWTSQIVGGQFNQFVADWYLTGIFVPSGGSIPVSAPPTTVAHRPTKPAGSTSTSAPPTTTTTHPKKPVAPPLSANVKLINCAATTGGWSAGGIVRNPATQALTYNITVNFTTSTGTVLASGTDSVALTAGGSNLWSASAMFSPPSGTRCALGSVTKS
jgi:hypothetical protein